MILFVDDAFVPPVFAVYQPSNLYPFLVRLSNAPYSLPVISVLAAGVEGPPFASNFKVYSFDQREAPRRAPFLSARRLRAEPLPLHQGAVT